MKSINKTKNDSISEQASATKEEMIEFASKYKNIEAFKDSDDETTYWVIMLFILLMYNKSSCLKKPVFMRVSAISISLLITN